jgi:hypothetical protein
MTRRYLSLIDLKRVHPNRPTMEQVRIEIERGRFVEGVHFVRTANGRALFTDIATKVGIGPRPSRVPR